MYRVKLTDFEGPLDLLLFFIKRDELDITNIPIARITQEYLESLQLIASLDLEVAGEFIVMAATLMQIKVRMLLPRDENAETEEDPRDGRTAAQGVLPEVLSRRYTGSTGGGRGQRDIEGYLAVQPDRRV
jgi:chromatin segregation and condensation protein Rec8/ScpA/Scc1 (kleisin family)